MSEHFIQRPRYSAAIVASHPARSHELQRLVADCGCLLRHFGEECDFLLVARSSVSDVEARDWSDIAVYLDDHDSEALVWSDLDGLDEAFAALPVDRCHFLVDTPDWQAIAILTGVAKRIRGSQLHDSARDSEILSLHRISNELADFAQTLASIAKQDGAPQVRERPVSFRPAPQGLLDSFATERAPEPSARPQDVRAIIKLRRLRDRYFQPDLFADPGWDIMLDLYAARQEGKQVSVSSLCIAAAVPPTTALRWITNMTAAGLLVRVQDPDAARRVFIELSAEARDQLDAYFAAARNLAVPAI
jgi:DNA-binding MarR family transcriptional regulator